ncbi:MAG: AraC family transcriptional regulator [Sphingomonas sp.]
MQSSQFFTVDARHKSETATVQVGRYHLDEPLDDMLRIGDGYRLNLLLSGRGGNPRARYRDRWASHRFAPVGSLFLVREDEPVVARREASAGTSMSCRLKPRALEAWFDGDLRWTDPALEESLDLGSAPLKYLLRRMVLELNEPGFAHAVMMDALVAQAVVELSRYCTKIVDRRPNGGLTAWRLRRIDERLAEQVDAPTLDELARLCGLSVRQLTRGFRVSRGCSIADHVADRRLEHATRMLREGRSIKTVAGLIGYASVSSFTYAFRKSTGLTPGAFRARSV